MLIIDSKQFFFAVEGKCSVDPAWINPLEVKNRYSLFRTPMKETNYNTVERNTHHAIKSVSGHVPVTSHSEATKNTIYHSYGTSSNASHTNTHSKKTINKYYKAKLITKEDNHDEDIYDYYDYSYSSYSDYSRKKRDMSGNKNILFSETKVEVFLQPETDAKLFKNTEHIREYDKRLLKRNIPYKKAKQEVIIKDSMYNFTITHGGCLEKLNIQESKNWTGKSPTHISGNQDYFNNDNSLHGRIPSIPSNMVQYRQKRTQLSYAVREKRKAGDQRLTKTGYSAGMWQRDIVTLVSDPSNWEP